MKVTTFILFATLIAILVAAFTPRSFKLAALNAASLFTAGLREQFATANVETATGTNRIFDRRADAAHSYTHLLVKPGTDAFHVAVCGAADRPSGSTTDSPDAAEDILHVDPLNRTDSSRRLRCATALAANIDVYTAANGFVQAEPTSAGTYWLVGRTAALAVQEGSNNFVVEVVTQPPIKLTVAAAPSTVGNIATALATPGLVKFLA